MKKYKYVSNAGLAFKEEKEMEKLSRYAEEGWHFEKFAFLGFFYKLKKGERKHVVYSIDYNWPDDEYFSFFQEAGWTPVYSHFDMNVFVATEGTAPIYSDKNTMIDKYERERLTMKKVAFPCLFITIFFFLLAALSNLGVLPDMFETIGMIVGIIMIIPLTFSGMPYLSYRRKLNKLRDQ